MHCTFIQNVDITCNGLFYVISNHVCQYTPQLDYDWLLHMCRSVPNIWMMTFVSVTIQCVSVLYISLMQCDCAIHVTYYFYFSAKWSFNQFTHNIFHLPTNKFWNVIFLTLFFCHFMHLILFFSHFHHCSC